MSPMSLGGRSKIWSQMTTRPFVERGALVVPRFAGFTIVEFNEDFDVPFYNFSGGDPDIPDGDPNQPYGPDDEAIVNGIFSNDWTRFAGSGPGPQYIFQMQGIIDTADGHLTDGHHVEKSTPSSPTGDPTIPSVPFTVGDYQPSGSAPFRGTGWIQGTNNWSESAAHESATNTGVFSTVYINSLAAVTETTAKRWSLTMNNNQGGSAINLVYRYNGTDWVAYYDRNGNMFNQWQNGAGSSNPPASAEIIVTGAPALEDGSRLMMTRSGNTVRVSVDNEIIITDTAGGLANGVNLAGADFWPGFQITGGTVFNPTYGDAARPDDIGLRSFGWR